ncbi:MAG: CDP-alcohol phosphatidyltransferase family protein [Planctomycetaceae bacterium]
MIPDPPYAPTDRRPLKSRGTAWAKWASHGLASAGVSPNAISVFGMVAAGCAGCTFAATSHWTGVPQRLAWLLGAILCQVRLLCNLFDGMVAIERKIASPTGELYNEVPDRVSDSAIFIGLGYAAGGGVTFGYLAALVAVFVAYVRMTAANVGAPNDFCGPLAKPQRMALVTMLGVYMTFAPGTWHGLTGEARAVLLVVIAGGLITAIRRLWRAAVFLGGQTQ